MGFISINCSTTWPASPQPLLQVIISLMCVLLHPLLCQPLPCRTGIDPVRFAIPYMKLYRFSKEATRGTACFALHWEGSRSGQEVMVTTGSRGAWNNSVLRSSQGRISRQWEEGRLAAAEKKSKRGCSRQNQGRKEEGLLNPAQPSKGLAS